MQSIVPKRVLIYTWQSVSSDLNHSCSSSFTYSNSTLKSLKKDGFGLLDISLFSLFQSESFTFKSKKEQDSSYLKDGETMDFMTIQEYLSLMTIFVQFAFVRWLMRNWCILLVDIPIIRSVLKRWWRLDLNALYAEPNFYQLPNVNLVKITYIMCLILSFLFLVF